MQTPRDALLDRLLQQRQGLSGLSSECIGRSQGRGDPGDCEPEVRPLREVEGAFEHRDGLVEVPLAQIPKASGPIRHDLAVGVVGSLGNPPPFLRGSPPLSEGAALGKVAGEETTGEHRGQTRQAEALME